MNKKFLDNAAQAQTTFLGILLFSIPTGFVILNWVALMVSLLILVFQLPHSVKMKLFLGMVILRFILDLLQIRTWNPLFLPTVAFLLGSYYIPKLKQDLKSMLSTCKLAPTSILLAVSTSILSAGALVAWKNMIHPDLSDKLDFIPNVPTVALLLGGITFSVLNAATEEFVFRGLFWGILLESKYSLFFSSYFIWNSPLQWFPKWINRLRDGRNLCNFLRLFKNIESILILAISDSCDIRPCIYPIRFNFLGN